jgi:hypothetical protein
MKRTCLLFCLLGCLSLWAPTARAEDAPPASQPADELDREALVHDADPADELAQWGLGPFEIAEPYVLALYRARPWATSPEVPGHLNAEFALRGAWANSHGFEQGRFVVDAETRHGFLSGRLGIGDRFSAGAMIEYQWRGGGDLDGFIDDFHEVFGLPSSDRNKRPHGRYQVAGLKSDGTSFVGPRSGWGLSDLTLEARGQILKGDATLPALTATLRLRVPIGRSRWNLSDGVDATLGLDASKRIGVSPLILYAGASFTYYAHTRIGGLVLSRQRGFGYVGFEWQLSLVSLVVHAWVESPRERKLWRDTAGVQPTKLAFGNYVSYVAFGFKSEPIEGLIFELGVLENLFDPEVSADFTVLFNITLKL